MDANKTYNEISWYIHHSITGNTYGVLNARFQELKEMLAPDDIPGAELQPYVADIEEFLQELDQLHRETRQNRNEMRMGKNFEPEEVIELAFTGQQMVQRLVNQFQATLDRLEQLLDQYHLLDDDRVARTIQTMNQAIDSENNSIAKAIEAFERVINDHTS